MRYHFLCLALALGVTASGRAQEKLPTGKELQERTVATMKKAEVKDPVAVETANLVVVAALPEAKVKALANSLEKTFDVATKGLKLDAREDDKEAKWSVYVFPNVDTFNTYVISALKRRREKDELSVMDTKAVTPFIAVSPKRGDANPNYEVLVNDLICGALLQKKGGNAALTEWMKDGFAKAVTMRMNAGVAGTDRGAVRRIAPPVPKSAKMHACVVDKAWKSTGKEKEQVAGCLMDYLVFGPGNAKLGGILSGLTPGDDNRDPTFDKALTSADWKLEDLDRDWRDWLAKGSPVAVEPKAPKK